MMRMSDAESIDLKVWDHFQKESIDLDMDEDVDPDLEEGRWSSTGSSSSLDSAAVTDSTSSSNRWADDFGRLVASSIVSSALDKNFSLDPESTHRVEEASRTYDISTKNLTYKINVRRGEPTEQKVLLNNITAEARHGEVLAIMGPSGASKTTFLDAIAGRISRKSMSGTVLVNGQPMTDQFKRVSGYVMQDDVHFPMLTARETLMYSARLRLPNSINLHEKKRRVEVILELLGLTACADTRIGNEEIGGVSGGERRRISIALDLVHDPMVLFLDEPTSGLDSTSALQVMQSLQKLAKERDRTIILTIHQPSYRILDTIDNSLVLAKGNVVYEGHHRDMIKFISNLGFVKPEHVTVVEYMMDKIEEYHGDLTKLQPKRPATMISQTQRQRQLSSYDYKVDRDEPSPLGEPELPRMSEDQPGELGPPDSEVKFANSLWKETWILAGRNFKSTFRTKTFLLSRIGTVLLTSLISGTLFFNSDRDKEGVREREVFFVFTVAILVFTSTEAMPVFLMERRIFIRETSRGAYRASSYVLSYSAVILPFLLLLAVLSTVTSYFAIGLVGKAEAVLYFGLVIFLVLSIANAFVAFISGVSHDFITGLIIFGGASAYQFLFCGFFVPRHTIPKYWIWLHYGSFFKYSYEALLVNEFRNLPGHIWFGGQTSERLLHIFDCNREMKNQWLNILYLVGFLVGYRFLFYLTLRFQTSNIRT